MFILIAQATYIFAQDDKTKPLFDKAYALFDAKKYDDAAKIFSEIIKITPENSQAYYDRGQCFYEKKEYKKAVEDFNRAIEIKDDDAFYYYSRGIAFFASGDYDAAIDDHTKELELSSGRALGFLGRAEAFWKKEDYESAMNDFSQATGLSNFPAPYLTRGTAYQKLGEKAKAIEDILIFAEDFPDYQPARKALLQLGLAEKDLPKPLLDAKEKIPANALKAYNTGLEKFAQNYRGDAKIEFTNATKLYPRFAEAFYYLGYIGETEILYGSADRGYSAALKIKPKFIEAMQGRARTYRFTGRDALALKEIDRAILLNPKAAKSYIVRAFVGNDEKKIIADLTKAIAVDQKNFTAYLERSIKYYNMDDYAKALNDAEKAIALRPNNYAGYEQRAMVFCKQGKKELAGKEEERAKGLGAQTSFPCASE